MEIQNSEAWAKIHFNKIMKMLNEHDDDEELFDDFNKTIDQLIESREEKNTLATDKNIFIIVNKLKDELSKKGEIELFEPFIYLDENNDRVSLTSKRDLTLVQFMVSLNHVCYAF